jgi:hypothetical protein
MFRGTAPALAGAFLHDPSHCGRPDANFRAAAYARAMVAALVLLYDE